ncbi:hypothetical protein SUDANB121_00628 [Nocardiopsis dassonvillei]|uniref:hypothetical protein n=1 Tax=Nocardiopsis dassonvillei TaxID=2014 RepID=UPI003F55668A
MYLFHPPTFEPGPLAAAVGLVLLVHQIVTPLLYRRPMRRARTLARGGDYSALARWNRRSAWECLVQLVMVMVFVGSATVVTPVDLGIFWPVMITESSGRGQVVMLLLSVFLVLSPALGYVLSVRAARAERAGRPLPKGALTPEQLSLVPRTAREQRARILPVALTALTLPMVNFVVLYPLLCSLTGDPLTVLFLLLCLGYWTWSPQGKQVTLALGSLGAAGTFMFASDGSLLLPVALWAVYALQDVLCLLPFLGQEPATPALEVTVLDADGEPVRRREG